MCMGQLRKVRHQLRSAKSKSCVLLAPVPSYVFSAFLWENQMVKNPWEANSCSAHLEISHVSCNTQFHCSVHNSLPLVPILSQMNPANALPSYIGPNLILLYLPWYKTLLCTKLNTFFTGILWIVGKGGGVLMQHSAISMEYCCAVYCRTDVKVLIPQTLRFVCVCSCQYTYL